jgi:hypothetical protein
VLLLLENAPLREAADVVSQPWFKLYSFLSTWRSDIDIEAWAHSTKGLASHPQVNTQSHVLACHAERACLQQPWPE